VQPTQFALNELFIRRVAILKRLGIILQFSSILRHYYQMPPTRRSAGKESRSSASSSPHPDPKGASRQGRRSPRLKKQPASTQIEDDDEHLPAMTKEIQLPSSRTSRKKKQSSDDPSAEPRDDPVQRLEDAGVMAPESHEEPDLDKPLYVPHGKWKYTEGKDFEGVEAIKKLSRE
jgi:hypothetical protein